MPYVIELTRAAGRRRALERTDRVRLLVAVRRAAREGTIRHPDDTAPATVDDEAAAGAEPARRPVT